MYTRQLKEPPKQIIQNGKAAFGAYYEVSPSIDIKGMRAPYAGIPLPSFLSNLRIKSRLVYVFSIDKYIGLSQFYDFKVFGLGEITFWHKESGKKYVYHTIMPPRRRFVPKLTTRGICACYRKSRYIKISWGRKHQHHALSYKVKGDSARPSSEGYFYSPMQDDMHRDFMFVNPSPTSSRCNTTWLSTMKLHGHITIKDEQADDSEGLGLMRLSRAYYKMHTNSIQVNGIGTVKDKNLIIYLETSNLDASDNDSYNSNLLVVDGKETTLPSVYITHPFGIHNKWIIQDTENMVDLSFTPVSVSSRILNIIALRADYNNIYGTLDGVLLTAEGEKITLKNFPCVLQKGQLRL